MYVAETENQEIVGFTRAAPEKFKPIKDLPQAEKLTAELGAIYVIKNIKIKISALKNP